MEIVRFTDEMAEKYEFFLKSRSDTLFYTSLACRSMLMNVLKDEDYYLIALENDSVIGVLPCFIHENDEYGAVINSLPYYGSNGGIIAQNEHVRDCLLEEFKRLAVDIHCVASTIISSPFDNSFEYYVSKLKPDMTDKRRGVVTFLPSISSGGMDELKRRIHKEKPELIRNLKKAERNEIKVCIDNTESSFAFLKKTHEDNMAIIGGPPKKASFFEYVKDNMISQKEYNLYIAYKEEKPIAALLLFYYNKTVEYYVPVVVEEYRTYQALSLIIYNAMKDAMEMGYDKWNWGGTGMTMDGVFRFKMKWAATECDYNYFTNIYDQSIMKLEKAEILQSYPNYYVFRF